MSTGVGSPRVVLKPLFFLDFDNSMIASTFNINNVGQIDSIEGETGLNFMSFAGSSPYGEGLGFSSTKYFPAN